MDSQPSAPPLVAVVVADQPGEWFEEALQALGSQDYPNQSVLVIDGAGRDDPGPRVAAVLPDAFLRRPARQGRPHGLAAAANDVLDTVQGAAFLVFCHDDVAPEPDALRLMVEESLRSNAGIVGPKLVDWDREDRLLSVGLSVDKTGATTSLVDRGELDQEQHDSVRDVFAVSSACFLIRADLFAELGGFDPAMGDYGADVDLCWRAQAAGARIVVAPEARVRHREAAAEQPGADPQRATLEPRNHLRAMLKNYTPLHLLRVLPQAMVATLVEAIVALIARRGHEAREVLGAWVWNLRHFGELRTLRAGVRQIRSVPDAEVRRLQARGSSRLTMYLQRRLHAEERARQLVEAGHELVESVGHGPARAATLLLCVLTLALLIGSRNLLTGRLPAVGQFAPFPRPSTLLTHLFDGWRTTGMGSTSPSPPAFGVLGVLGVVFLGHMGALAKILVLGAWPVAALGAWRLARPLDSPMARIAAVIACLAVPLPYNALARGRWTGLIAYAAMPWFLLLLARLTDMEPFGTCSGRETGGRRTVDGPAWRPYLVIGLPLAVVSVFVPGIGLAVVVAALGLVLGSMLVGGVGSATRALRGAVGGVVVAFVLLLPWSAALALPGGWSTVAGVGRLSPRAPGLGALLRFQIGPVGAGLFGWALLAVAATPLLVGRGWRFAWAVRFWTVVLLGVGLAWAGGRGWLPLRLQDPDLLLAPAAAALAGAVAMGAAAAQVDLRGYRFSWRQAAPLAGGLALVAAVLPIVSAARTGAWNLTSKEVAQSVGWMKAQAADGAFRVLWLGDPETLPLDGWALEGEQGVAFATSRNGPPDVSDLWPGPASGATERMGDAMQVARQGGTARLGRLLAPMGVRYIVVPKQLSTDDDRPEELGVPAPLTRALGSQLDLRLLPSDPALDVYENVSWGPLRSVLTDAAAVAVSTGAGSGAGADLAGSLAVLPGAGPVRFRGAIPNPGTVLLAEAPSGRWELSVDGRTVDRRDAFGVANAFVDSEAGSARLRYRTPLYRWPLAVLPFLLWAFAASVVWRTRARPAPIEPDTQLIPIYAETRA